jgi:AcrR family transcriptional regulator
VARLAEVSPSLASYYFIDRDGLIDAVRSERLLPLAQTFCQAVRDRRGDAAGGIAAFIQIFHAVASRNAWFVPLLFLHTPTAREDQPGRPSDALQPILTLLSQLVTGAQQAGAIRRDLRPEYVVMSLLSLCGFSFLARDTLAESLGIDRSAGSAAALTLHQMAILRGGLQSPRQDSRS